MRFKIFLEAVSGRKQVKYSALDTQKAIDLLNDKCKDALWMLELNNPIWRGDPKLTNQEAFLTADPTLTTRKSQNTSNFYTTLLDINPHTQDFPKRSKSFICSRDFFKSGGYRYSDVGHIKTDGLYAVIPFDGVKIGVVGKRDIWDTEIKMFGSLRSLIDWNKTFAQVISDNGDLMADFKKYQHAVLNDRNKFIKFKELFNPNKDRRVRDWVEQMLDEIERAYSPASTGFTCETTKTLNRKDKLSEVWVGGPCVLIHNSMWIDLLRTYNNERTR